MKIESYNNDNYDKRRIIESFARNPFANNITSKQIFPKYLQVKKIDEILDGTSLKKLKNQVDKADFKSLQEQIKRRNDLIEDIKNQTDFQYFSPTNALPKELKKLEDDIAKLEDDIAKRMNDIESMRSALIHATITASFTLSGLGISGLNNIDRGPYHARVDRYRRIVGIQ